MDSNAILTILITLVSGIIWLIRLEGRLNHHEKEIDRLSTLQENFDDKVMAQLSELQKSVARIEGALGVKGD